MTVLHYMQRSTWRFSWLKRLYVASRYLWESQSHIEYCMSFLWYRKLDHWMTTQINAPDNKCGIWKIVLLSDLMAGFFIYYIQRLNKWQIQVWGFICICYCLTSGNQLALYRHKFDELNLGHATSANCNRINFACYVSGSESEMLWRSRCMINIFCFNWRCALKRFGMSVWTRSSLLVGYIWHVQCDNAQNELMNHETLWLMKLLYGSLLADGMNCNCLAVTLSICNFWLWV
jgi:hypothetical protein